ncbi:hypothetical protein BRARA_C00558 [Brassica rapa]|uniref:DUF4283 domain-containing protein n=1 Tax=Brassica campestris TaxID=3711 RepID=A0A397ZS14_BRACM|nr:hypothetical protein BRARA_C00558 [Brassica rapa]
MSSRRLSTAEKGKGLVSDPYQAPSKARVRVQAPDNSFLIQQHSLTIVGRVTNPSAQKVWSLIPFFTEKWSTGTRPRGSDLGQGMFQFQFDNEADLLEVLDKRPYQYAKWMVIIQRWEPTTAPDFPCLIPFWIKVQGIPLHLWTEEAIRGIGQDIGVFEKAEITSLVARMRVQINGRLPLITSSVLEYPNGDEVKATLVYEKIGKHCSCCFRMDHELRDCLKAKAEKREARVAASDNNRDRSQSASSPGRHSLQYQQRTSNGKSERHGLVEGRSWYLQDRKLNRDQRPSENHPPQRNRDTYGKHLSHRDNHSRRFQPYGSSRYSRGAGGTNSRSTNYREVYRPLQPPINQAPPPPALPVRDRLSPRDTGRIDSIREESSSCKRTTPTSAKGTPLNESKLDQTTEALNAAREELRVTMTQYISCTDPAESAARRERVRQAEQNGIIEDSVSQMARAALARHQSPETYKTSNLQAQTLSENGQRLRGRAVPPEEWGFPKEG